MLYMIYIYQTECDQVKFRRKKRSKLYCTIQSRYLSAFETISKQINRVTEHLTLPDKKRSLLLQ